MFGANSGNTFGASNNFSSGGAFGAKPAAGGFLYGPTSNTTPSDTTGWLNGGKPQGPGGAGGTSSGLGSGQGLFGQQNANPGSGLFGGNSEQNSFSTNGTAGGLFGNNSANQASNNTDSLFGSGSTNNTNNTGGGLFGYKPPTSSQGGSLFGNAPNSNNNNNPNSNALGNTGRSLFGNSQGNSGGLFGAQNSGSMGNQFNFGNQQQQQQQQQNGLFGGNNNPQPSNLWNSTSSLSLGQAGQQQQPAAQNILNQWNTALMNFVKVENNIGNLVESLYVPTIGDQLIKIREKWDPNSPKCALSTHFYNKVTEQEAIFLSNQPRPSNETPEEWDVAMNNRPGPLYYPIKITSFSEVAQRIEVQLDRVAKSRMILNSINEKQSTLASKHDLDNTTRILKASAKHTKLSRRLLRLATVLAIIKLKGYPLLPEEEEISRQFELLNSQLSDPNSPIGKINDLFARLTTLEERAHVFNSEFESSMALMNGSAVNGVVSSGLQKNSESTDKLIKRVANLLLKQQAGLNYVNDILEKDLELVGKN